MANPAALRLESATRSASLKASIPLASKPQRHLRGRDAAVLPGIDKSALRFLARRMHLIPASSL
jgi:hypothetical protein